MFHTVYSKHIYIFGLQCLLFIHVQVRWHMDLMSATLMLLTLPNHLRIPFFRLFNTIFFNALHISPNVQVFSNLQVAKCVDAECLEVKWCKALVCAGNHDVSWQECKARAHSSGFGSFSASGILLVGMYYFALSEMEI